MQKILQRTKGASRPLFAQNWTKFFTENVAQNGLKSHFFGPQNAPFCCKNGNLPNRTCFTRILRGRYHTILVALTHKCTVGTKIIADSNTFLELISEILLISLWDRPRLELVFVSNNFQALRFLQDKLPE